MATAEKRTKEDIAKCRIITPKFRVSYPHVFKPSGMKGAPNSAQKYSVTMLFDKNTDLKKIKDAMTQAKIQRWGKNPKAWPKAIRSPVQNGDDPKYADREGYAGCWVIKASSNEDQKPTVVGPDVEPILNQADFYPGCYAVASVLAYAWDNQFGKGVGFILDHVQKVGDGKAFGGKPTAEQVFAPVGGDMDSEDFNENEADFV